MTLVNGDNESSFFLFCVHVLLLWILKYNVLILQCSLLLYRYTDTQ